MALDAAEPAVRGSRPLLRWIVAACLGAIVPALAFYALLTFPQDFDAAPSWSWLTIPVIPLASAILLFVSSDWIRKATRLVGAIAAIHAAIMAAMLGFGVWRPVAGMSVFVDLLLIATVIRPAFGWGAFGRFAKATIFWLAAFLGVSFPLALANAFIVMNRAEAIAGDRPYCIQYPSQTDAFAYNAVRTVFDVSPLKLQTRLASAGYMGPPLVMQYNGVLVLDDGRVFNWSYRREDFLNNIKQTHVAGSAVCAPAPHYARQLPLWLRPPGTFDIAMAGRHFSIPEAYRPRRHANRLLIDAAQPDFGPYDSKKSHLDHSWSTVAITGDPVDLSSILERRIASFAAAQKMEPEFNLAKIQLYAYDKNHHRQWSTGILYSAHDEAGRVTNLIDCGPKAMTPRPTCWYQFAVDGLTFNLWLDDPSQWQRAQQKLAALISSFEVVAQSHTQPPPQ
jgi:hypothetical protein